MFILDKILSGYIVTMSGNQTADIWRDRAITVYYCPPPW